MAWEYVIHGMPHGRAAERSMMAGPKTPVPTLKIYVTNTIEQARELADLDEIAIEDFTRKKVNKPLDSRLQELYLLDNPRF